jgi:hypothetical protein
MAAPVADPVVGVLLLDLPRYVADERLCRPGDSGLDDRPVGFSSNPSSWNCRTYYRVARGWTDEASAAASDDGVDALRRAARELDGKVDVITTNCAYSWFSREAFSGLSTTALASGLALLPLAQNIASEVAVVVSHSPTVLSLMGEVPAGVRIVELEHMPEWERYHAGADNGSAPLSQERLASELAERLKEDIRAHGRPGACVLECSGLPQFHEVVRSVYQCPVLDIVTVIHGALGREAPRLRVYPT